MTSPFQELSPRELQVLDELAAHKQNKEIAHSLGLSMKTVEVHRANIMRKTGAQNAFHLGMLYGRFRTRQSSERNDLRVAVEERVL